MKFIDKWIEENRKTLKFAILLNALVLLFMVIVMYPRFETNDDVSMMMIVNYSRGFSSARLICENYILGLIYQAMYSLGHGLIPWYTILQWVLIYISFTSMTYVLMQKFEKAYLAIAINLIMLSFFGYECYIQIQFTKTAGITMVAGVLLMFHALTREKILKGAFVLGVILTFFGGLYRFEEAACCCALMSGIGVYKLLTLNELQKKQRVKQVVSYILGFGFMLACLFGAEAYDRFVMYHDDPRWAEYSRLSDLRCELMDYGFPDYEEHKEEFEALGINKEALKVMKSSYAYYDPDVITADKLEAIVAMKEKSELNKAFLGRFFQKYPVGFFGIYTFFAFLLMAGGWIFWRKKGWKPIIVAVYEICMMGGFDLYLFYNGRYLENRVEVGMWLAITVVVISLFDEERIRIGKESAYILLFVILAMNQDTWKNSWRLNHDVIQKTIDKEYMRTCFEDATQDKDALYMADVGSFSYSSYDAFSSVPEGIFSNVVWFGGWEVGNPEWVDVMAEHGVISPYGDIIDKNVYVADCHASATFKHIKKNHQENTEQVLVKEYDYFSLYQYKTKEEKKK